MKPKPNRSPRARHRDAPGAPNYGLARVLNKQGLCSRSQAEALVRAGRVRVDGRVVHDPQAPTALTARVAVDGAAVTAATRRYLALNKPRGYVTSARDERGRDTVYALLAAAGFGGAEAEWIAPVGRLDKASEGLLLFSNDSAWAARLTDPATHLDKTYHVQIDALADAELLARLRAGVEDDGERLTFKSVRELRRGEKQAWLEIVLDEGRNRHIRRVLAACDVGVKRLVRVAIGTLALGDLAKAAVRELSTEEVKALGG